MLNPLYDIDLDSYTEMVRVCKRTHTATFRVTNPKWNARLQDPTSHAPFVALITGAYAYSEGGYLTQVSNPHPGLKDPTTYYFQTWPIES